MAKPTQPQKNRIETILAFMMAGVIGISVLAILLMLLSALFKFALPTLFALLPMIGLPMGALIMIALIIVQARNRPKDKR
jgi:hypothetical protein